MKIHSNGRLTKNTVSLMTATFAVVIGLSACGKFSAIDPKAKGTSTNSNPLAADEEDRLRDLVASASPTPSPAPGQRPAAGAADDADRDAALDQARQLFGDELNGRQAPPPAPVAAPATAASPVPAPPGAPAAPDAPAVAAVPGQVAPPAPVPPAPAPPSAQPAASKALIAEDVTDEAKRDLILQLIEPTMRINFRLSLQRGEILEFKKILDAKKELSAEQAAKLSQFKQSYLLIDADSIDALLSRVDVVNTSLQIAPLLLKTHWQTKGSFSQEDISARVQMLNTYPADEAMRFRSARLALKLTNEKPTSKKIMTAELGYDPDSNRNELAESTLKTVDEVLRIMALYSAEITKMINETSAKLVAEHGKK